MKCNDLCFCGSGKKHKKCHFDINPSSKLADIYRTYKEFDKYAKNNNIYNNCISGCYRCCKGVRFFITENEFMIILDYIMTNFPNELDVYIQKAKSFAKKFQNVYPDDYYNLCEKINTFQTANCDGLNYLFQDNICKEDEYLLPECIFLNKQHKCSIYEVRPVVCREYSTCQACCYNNNIISEFKEKQNMEICSLSIDYGNNPRIIKRLYPLFYWFSYFLQGKYKLQTLDKLDKIKHLSNYDYYLYSKALL